MGPKTSRYSELFTFGPQRGPITISMPASMRDFKPYSLTPGAEAVIRERGYSSVQVARAVRLSRESSPLCPTTVVEAYRFDHLDQYEKVFGPDILHAYLDIQDKKIGIDPFNFGLDYVKKTASPDIRFMISRLLGDQAPLWSTAGPHIFPLLGSRTQFLSWTEQIRSNFTSSLPWERIAKGEDLKYSETSWDPKAVGLLKEKILALLVLLRRNLYQFIPNETYVSSALEVYCNTGITDRDIDINCTPELPVRFIAGMGTHSANLFFYTMAHEMGHKIYDRLKRTYYDKNNWKRNCDLGEVYSEMVAMAGMETLIGTQAMVNLLEERGYGALQWHSMMPSYQNIGELDKILSGYEGVYPQGIFFHILASSNNTLIDLLENMDGFDAQDFYSGLRNQITEH